MNGKNRNGKNDTDHNDKATFIQKYLSWFWGTPLALLALYALVYGLFVGKGIITPGVELDKKDWLSFLGSYLSFAGTMMISLVAILQSSYYAEIEKNRKSQDRHDAIQPIITITLPDNLSTNSTESVTVFINNAGEYPICNVCLFNKYYWPLLIPNETKDVTITYSESGFTSSGTVLKLTEAEYPITQYSIPKEIIIQYHDIDGAKGTRSFELDESTDKPFYSRKATQ